MNTSTAHKAAGGGPAEAALPAAHVPACQRCGSCIVEVDGLNPCINANSWMCSTTAAGQPSGRAMRRRVTCGASTKRRLVISCPACSRHAACMELMHHHLWTVKVTGSQLQRTAAVCRRPPTVAQGAEACCATSAAIHCESTGTAPRPFCFVTRHFVVSIHVTPALGGCRPVARLPEPKPATCGLVVPALPRQRSSSSARPIVS